MPYPALLHPEPLQQATADLYLLSEVKSLSHVQLFATPWTVAYQAPPSMGVFQARILEWAAIPSPGDLPNPGTFGQLNTFKILLLPLLDMTVINV